MKHTAFLLLVVSLAPCAVNRLKSDRQLALVPGSPKKAANTFFRLAGMVAASRQGKLGPPCPH